MRLQPFSSKNLRYFSRISAVVMYFILVNSPFHLVRGRIGSHSVFSHAHARAVRCFLS